jgi:alkyl sulfatase BDS1-like metallo-beta-lactamase superfamily hydrolase
MKDLLELAELAWNGEIDLQFKHHPVHAFYSGSTELRENVLGIKGIAGHYTIDTGDGLVMIDAGSQLDIHRTYEEIRKWRPDTPVKAAIFTHHHIDHVFAVKHFDEENEKRGIPAPIVYGHKLMPDHFDRYIKTKDWNTTINRRQFAIDLEHFEWPKEYRYPDITYTDNMSFTFGNVTFELHHARGETDDHTWVYIPEEKIIASGDLFIWAVPNAGNPQKVQRYISDWANALDDMLALDCDVFLPGHGFPIFGKERIKLALETTSKFLRSIEDQTLQLMNQGKSLNQVLHEVNIPNKLMEYPWLRPIYDDPQFLIRMVWRRYGGWWDGEYDRLLPSTRKEEAAIWVQLSGGIENIIAKALENSVNGNHKIAAHLIETAFHADNDNKDMHKARADIYKKFALNQSSSMGRNILNHASLASLKGKRDLAQIDD